MFKKKINSIRRAIMGRLTRSLGRSQVSIGDRPVSPQEIRRVLVCRPNHRLGNLLLITPLLAELEDVLPEAKVDVFAKGTIAPILFKNYRNIDRILQLPKRPFSHPLNYFRGWFGIAFRRYDLVINAAYHSSSGRICAKLASAPLKFLGELGDDVPSGNNDYVHMGKGPVYNFRRLMQKVGLAIGDRSVAPLDLRLSASEIMEGKKILDGLIRNERKTIAIYTYATGFKCYSKEWWENFYRKLQSAFPEYNIIEVLPIENVSQIGFRARSYYSKDLRQIGSLIANVELFIGADGGMMHLASAAQTPVIGLFKAKNIINYAPYNNGSAGVDTTEVDNDALIGLVASRLHAPVTRQSFDMA